MTNRVRGRARSGARAKRIVLVLALAACERVTAKPAAAVARAEQAPVAAPLRVPADSEIPAGPLGVSIRRGRALLLDTRDSLPRNVGNALRCASCHLDGGMRAWSSPWIGVYARFPQYRSRSASVNVLEDRINDCFERSMNGTALSATSREMRDIVAYMAFLSRGIPVGGEVEGQGFAKLTPVAGDSTRGARLFGATCAVCHGAAGEGTRVAPPVWGNGSYNIGAGMARARTAAAFIRRNMPYDKPGTLSDADAFDLAAYIDSRPRPDLPGKERDWPNGDAPPDVAYPTLARKKGHQ
ncbi:MAG: c-type cytochrome [Gemmatimonadaceae bacterium]